jgi:uncharacterized membrane protein (GlpM family)
MNRRAALAFGADVLALALFVVIGRRNHHETGNAVIGAVRIIAPFLIALVIGWLVVRADRAPIAIRTGVPIWVCTVVIGLALRRLAFDRGIALGFIIVATITLGVFLIGWRAVVGAVRRQDRSAPV